MKILIIHPIFSHKEARGSEIIAQDTYRMLKEAGYKVYFFATDKKPYLENAEWTKYFTTYNKHFSIKNYWNKEAQKNLEKMLDEIKPNLIHVHITKFLSYSIFKPIFERNIPVVMTIHDPGILCPASYGWDDITHSPCNKCQGLNTIPCIIKNCNISKKRISSFNVAVTNFLEKISGYNNKISKFIIPSNALKNYVQGKIISSEKIEVVPNFLNSDFLNHISFTNKQDYFLFVGSLADYKGVNTLLNAVKDLPKNIQFKIIGSGFQEDKYQQYINENHLENVQLLGNLNRNEIIQYYQNCIALIVPSNYFEIFGIINLEAFACKKPVIASNIGGIPEIVEDNQSGMLFEPNNVEQLKNCIIKYFNDKDLAKEHGENGYKKIFEKYTADIYYSVLIRIYEEVLENYKK